jgi:hypothetical protein
MPTTLHDLALDEACDFLKERPLVDEPSVTRIGYYCALRMKRKESVQSNSLKVSIQCDAFDPGLVDWTKLLVRFGSGAQAGLSGYAYLNQRGAGALEIPLGPSSELLKTLRAKPTVHTLRKDKTAAAAMPAVALSAAAADDGPPVYAERNWHDFLWLVAEHDLQIGFQRRGDLTLIGAFSPDRALDGTQLVVHFVQPGNGVDISCPTRMFNENETPRGLVEDFDLLIDPGGGAGGCAGLSEHSIKLGEYELWHEVVSA